MATRLGANQGLPAKISITSALTSPIDIVVGAVLEGSRDGDRYQVDRLGLVGRRDVGFSHRRVLPRGKTATCRHDRAE